MRSVKLAQKTPQVRTLSFRADQETIDVLEELKAALGPEVAGKHSVAIRKAILEAGARLRSPR